MQKSYCPERFRDKFSVVLSKLWGDTEDPVSDHFWKWDYFHFLEKYLS